MSWKGVAVAVAAALVLRGALEAAAETHYPAPGFFDRGLTPRSSWEEILRTRGIQANFPLVSLGSMFVPVSAVCVERGLLRVADPRMDRGLRVAVPSNDAGGPRYMVSVDMVIQTGNTPWRSFLFDKAWDVPACGAR